MRSLLVLSIVIALAAPATGRADPVYQIVDLGVVNPGDISSQGIGIASGGGVVTGLSLGSTGSNAYSWTPGGGLVGLPNLASPSRPFGQGNAANNQGTIVGTGTSTSLGANPLPLVWQNGAVSQLPLPAGQPFGRALGLNNAGVAVGSVGSGPGEVGVIYSGGAASIITTTTANGSFIRTAYGINDSGLVVGVGVDPSNLSRDVGFLYDSVHNTASEIGALPGTNGAIALGVSNTGFVVGISTLNQVPRLPFIWSSATGIQPIGLVPGTFVGDAHAVNASGWVVGTDSGTFTVPFLFDGTTTFRLADLIDPASGWDLLTNISSAAFGISDNGTIVGTGVHNGQVRAFVLIPIAAVPEPSSLALFGLGGAALVGWRRWRKQWA
jgi:hypothetical protein